MQFEQQKNNKDRKPKVLAIVGQTATGKSDIGVFLAKSYNGEIISCDSRQVYKGLNLGTGKITKKEMCGVPHHLLDVKNPRDKFTAVDFQKLGERVIKKILAENKNPIAVGGTGFYAEMLLEGWQTPNVGEDRKLRKELEKKNIAELLKILNKLDKERAKSIDTKNKVRIIRSIEIAKSVGKIPKILRTNPYEVLWIGLTLPNKVLKQKISKRLKVRIDKGMIKEAKGLHKKGLSYIRMEELGLEYRYMARFLNKKISKQEMINQLEKEIWRYAKRQKTWFKKIEGINWFNPNHIGKIKTQVKQFLKLKK